VLTRHPLSARSSRLLAALAAGLLAALLGSAPAFADDTDAISAGPGDDRTRLSYQLQPGQHLDDEYVVRNTGTTEQTITLFATDAFNTDDGQYALLDTAKKPTGVGTWVLFDGSQASEKLTLPPGQQKTVPFTLVVPADARPGDHAGGIVVSSQKGDGQILVDRRVATRLYVRVPGDLQPALTVADVSADYRATLNPFDGSTAVTFTVRNNGNVALGAHLLVGAKALFGIPAGSVRQDLPELLPGNTRSLTVVVPHVGQVGYLNPYVELQPTVSPDALNPGPLRPISRDTLAFAMPWWLLAALVVAGGVLLYLRLRRRNDGKRAAAWIAYTEEEARRKANDEREAVSTGTEGGSA
jgi:Bacterial protein of unknown function (DUF916)